MLEKRTAFAYFFIGLFKGYVFCHFVDGSKKSKEQGKSHSDLNEAAAKSILKKKGANDLPSADGRSLAPFIYSMLRNISAHYSK